MTQPTSVLSPAVGGIASLFDIASEVTSRPGEPGGEGAFGNVLSDIAASDAVSSRDGVSPGDAVRLGDLVSTPFAATSAGDLIGEAAAEGVAMPKAGISSGSTLLENFRIAREGTEGSQIINRLSPRESDVAATVADSIKTGVAKSSAEGARVTDPRSMEWVVRQPVTSRREEFFEVTRSTPPTTFTVSEPTPGLVLKTTAARLVPAVAVEDVKADTVKADAVTVAAVKADAPLQDVVASEAGVALSKTTTFTAPLSIDDSRMVDESRFVKLPEVALPDPPQDSPRPLQSNRKDGADDPPALAVRTPAEQITVSLAWTTQAAQVAQVAQAAQVAQVAQVAQPLPIVRQDNGPFEHQSVDTESSDRPAATAARPVESLITVARNVPSPGRLVPSSSPVAANDRVPANDRTPANDAIPVTREAPPRRTAVTDGLPVPLVNQETPVMRVNRSEDRGSSASTAPIPFAATATASPPKNSAPDVDAPVASRADTSRADASPLPRLGMPATAATRSRMPRADDVATSAVTPVATPVLSSSSEGTSGLKGLASMANVAIAGTASVPAEVGTNPKMPIGLPAGLVLEGVAIRAEVPQGANPRVAVQAPIAATIPSAKSAPSTPSATSVPSAVSMPSALSPASDDIAVVVPGLRIEGPAKPTPAAMQRTSVADQTRPLPGVTVLPVPAAGQPVLAPAQGTPPTISQPASFAVPAAIATAVVTPVATPVAASVAATVTTPSSIPTTTSGAIASSFALGDSAGVDVRAAVAAPASAPASASAVTTPTIDAGRSVQAQFVAGAAEFVAARFESVRRPIAARDSVGSGIGREFVPLTPSSGTAVSTSAATVAAGNRVAESTAVSGANSAAAAQLVPTAPASIAPVVTPEVMTADPVAPFEIDMKSDTWEMDLGDILGKVIDSGEDRAVVKLSPEGLGDLEISVTVREGEVQVAFGAAIAETRAALEQAMPKLRDLLGQGGLELANAGVYSNLPRDAERRDSQSEMTRGNVFRGAEDSVDSEQVASRPRESDGLVDLYA